MIELELCPKCGSKYFSIARNMIATRQCKCGHTWTPPPKSSVCEKEHKKTYADFCLEKAWKASKPPWEESFWVGPLEGPNGPERVMFAHGPARIYKDGDDPLPVIKDAEFIAASPVMVRELARRLEKACRYIRGVASRCAEGSQLAGNVQGLAEELEAMPE